MDACVSLTGTSSVCGFRVGVGGSLRSVVSSKNQSGDRGKMNFSVLFHDQGNKMHVNDATRYKLTQLSNGGYLKEPEAV